MSVRVDKRAVFELVRYEPHAGQSAVHASEARFRLMACGARFGKSTCAGMEAVCAMLQPCEKSIGWVVAPTLELTKHTVDRVRITLLQHFPGRVLDDDTRNHRLLVKNLGGGTSEMRGKTADNPTSLLGEGLDWLVVDEAAKLREEVWSSYLAPRLVDRQGWALLISTPRGMNWFFKEWRRGQKGRDPEYASWRAPTTANPHISPEIIESERRRMLPLAFAQEYDAIFDGEGELPCETCHGPREDACSVLVILDFESVPRCKECHEPVDERGLSVVKRGWDGKPRLFVINGWEGLRCKLRYEPNMDLSFLTPQQQARLRATIPEPTLT